MRMHRALSDTASAWLHVHGFSLADFFQGMLIDSATHEFSFGNLRDPRQLFVICNSIPSSSVLDGRMQGEHDRITVLWTRAASACC